MVIGALRGTTGEARLLVLAGITNEEGVLAAGVRILTPSGTVTADSSDRFFIHAAGASPGLEQRSHLYPASEAMPQVRYMGDQEAEAEMITALVEGRIDGVSARSHRQQRRGRRVRRCPGGHSRGHRQRGTRRLHGRSPTTPTSLRCLDSRIEWLTDNNRIGFLDWRDDPTVCMTRAQLWNEQN